MKRVVVVAYMTTIVTCILSVFVLSVLFVWTPAKTASARGKDKEVPYVPNVIPSPQEHAWCYVLVNDNSVINNINILACVPKE